MTQILEAITPPGVDFDEAGCPFDHETPDPPTVENNLIGNGTTLRARMKQGTSTGTYGEFATKQEKVPNPRDVHGSSIAKGKKPKKRVEGQREMLLPISGSGKREAKDVAKPEPNEKPAAKPQSNTPAMKFNGQPLDQYGRPMPHDSASIQAERERNIAQQKKNQEGS